MHGSPWRQALTGSDSCANQGTILLDQVVNGTTEGAQDDFRCGLGPDVVYGFVPPATGPYQLRFLIDGGTVDEQVDLGLKPFLSGDACDAGICFGTTPHVVNFRGTVGVPQFFVLEATRTTDYQFVVSTLSPPPNDTCAGEAPLLVGVPVEARVEDAFFDSCPYRPDVFYGFTAPAAGRYRFVATDGLVGAVPGACAEFCGPGYGTTVWDLQAGDHLSLTLTGLGHTAGLRVDQVAPPPNGTCDTAATVTPGVPLTGDTTGASSVNTCHDVGMSDLLYTFTSLDGGAFQARVHFDGGAPGDPGGGSLVVPFVVAGPCQSYGEVDCFGTSELPAVNFRATPGVPVHLLVVGYGAGTTFSLDVQPLAAAPGDTCAGPAPLALGVPTTVSFEGALDDYPAPGSGCGLGFSSDVVLSFTPPATGSYAFSTTRGTLFVFARNCSTNCTQGFGQGVLPLTAGLTYLVLVEGAGAAAATVRVDAVPSAGPCSAPPVLTPGTPVRGRTQPVGGDQFCGLPATQVFSFMPPDAGTYQFWATPVAGGDPLTLMVVDSEFCGTGPCARAPTSQGYLLSAEAAVPRFVVVGTASGQAVDFDLLVRPVPTAAFDTCATAGTLALDTPLTVDLTYALNDYPYGNQSCALITAHDAVLDFTPRETGSYRYSVTGDSSLSINAGACPSRCDIAWVQDLPLWLEAGVTYHALLKSRDDSATVRVVKPPPPDNVHCAAAVPLVLYTPVRATTVGGEPNACGGGPAVYFSFTPQHEGAFRLSPRYWWRPVYAFLADGACDAGACPPLSPGPVRFRGYPGETQYIGVQTVDGIGADFELAVQESSPSRGDDCMDPGWLPLGVNVVDTNYALDDSSPDGGCGVPGARDVVFLLRPPQSGLYRVSSDVFALSVGPAPCGAACQARGREVEVEVHSQEGVFVFVSGQPAPGPGNQGQVTVEFVSLFGVDGGLVPDSSDAGAGGGTGTGPPPGPSGCGCASDVVLWPVLGVAFFLWSRRRGR